MSDALGHCPIPKLCPENKRHQVILAEEWSSKDGLRFRLKCSHSCFRQRLCPAGLLSKVHVSLWLAIIYFVKAMRLNYRWTKLMTDMESVFGVKNKRTFQTWRGLYQDALKLYLQKHGSITLGKSPGDVVVFDETHIGSQRGISKSSSSERAAKLKIGSSNETEDCKAPASPHRA